jgi:phosphoglycerate dehydrogenase-like enzyme
LPDDRLLILTPDAATYAALAADAGLDDLEIHAATEVDQARTTAAGCNVVLGVPALVAGLLDAMPRLGWVQSTYAGVDALCRPGLRRDYTLTG